MARYSTTYRGTYGGTGAGTAGRDIELSGESIPSEKLITSITYSLVLSASYASSSQYWRMIEMTIEGSSISADEDEISMGSSNRTTLEGSLNFSRSDISAFSSGTFTLHTKANCTGKASSYMWEVSITVNYKDVYDISDISADSSVDAGQKLSVSVSNAESSELFHIIKCSFGSYAQSKTLAVGQTSAEFDIPLEWCKAIPSSTSGTITISATTYESDGTPAGSGTTTATLNVPTSVKPTVGNVSAQRIANGVPSSWGDVYVQGITGISLAVSNCAGAYGSSIVSYTFSGIASQSSKTTSCTINPIQESGNVHVTVKCTDSRGRDSDEYTFPLKVIPYSSPAISGAMAYRCDAEGVSNEQGTYVRAQAAVEYSPCSKDDGTARNAITLKSFYQKIGDSDWTAGVASMTPGNFYTFGGGQIATANTYQVKFVVFDAFKTVERVITVSTSQFLVFFRRGGTAIGIGKKSRSDKAYIVDISEDWDVWQGNLNVTQLLKSLSSLSVPDIVYSQTQPEAKAGRIWLKPKG